VGYESCLPAMGGKRTARIARKISELHMATDGRGWLGCALCITCKNEGMKDRSRSKITTKACQARAQNVK
jgi:hypothetical protein